ncbi:hypothetical protein [Yinghuangia sp. YIM S10712]|uniref:hypothetical protein n=1 Tax=Yinghuangia sp. YIM S10712 TaxID=3436930 RepID=UPI003F52AD48
MPSIAQTPPPVTDGPQLVAIPAESLPNTGRYETTAAEYVTFAGIQVFSTDTANMPRNNDGLSADAFLLDEHDIPAALIYRDDLDPADVESVVFALVTKWARGADVIAVRKVEEDAR